MKEGIMPEIWSIKYLKRNVFVWKYNEYNWVKQNRIKRNTLCQNEKVMSEDTQKKTKHKVSCELWERK